MKSCYYYKLWITTSQGEVNDVCVNDEKRTIRRCPFYRKGWTKCPEYKPCKAYPGDEDKAYL